jgi:ribosomal protein S18 acetylase RimI-like enzyme
MMTIERRPSASRVHRPWLVDGERATLEAVWAASQDADDRASRPATGWWSVTAWATATRALVEGGEVIGLVAIWAGDGDAAEARLALAPGRRTVRAARALLRGALDLAGAADAGRLRLFAPRGATWVGEQARAAGFVRVRELHTMARPAAAGPLAAAAVPGVRIRELRPGEEAALLAALNRAWAGTWNFRPIEPAALARDLHGQRAGMLVAVPADDGARIVATCHAIFDAAARNPDGGPYAWISNLTTDPAWRGRGLARAMLAAGVTYLRSRGAGSVALGVDGGNVVPLSLYRASGFEILSTLDVWEHH